MISPRFYACFLVTAVLAAADTPPLPEFSEKLPAPPPLALAEATRPAPLAPDLAFRTANERFRATPAPKLPLVSRMPVVPPSAALVSAMPIVPPSAALASTMPIVPPDPAVDYKLRIKEPDVVSAK